MWGKKQTDTDPITTLRTKVEAAERDVASAMECLIYQIRHGQNTQQELNAFKKVRIARSVLAELEVQLEHAEEAAIASAIHNGAGGVL
jgi:hypothetical protein